MLALCSWSLNDTSAVFLLGGGLEGEYWGRRKCARGCGSVPSGARASRRAIGRIRLCLGNLWRLYLWIVNASFGQRLLVKNAIGAAKRKGFSHAVSVLDLSGFYSRRFGN